MAKYASKYVGEGSAPQGWTKVGSIAVNETGTASLPETFTPGISDTYDTNNYVVISDTTTAGLVGRPTGGGTGTASANLPTYWVSSAKTDESFLNLAKRLTGSQSLTDATAAKTLLNSSGYWTSWTLVGFDADAQAFFTSAGITDTTQKNAVNQLVIDLKGYGIWTKMKALYPFVGGTATTHKYNLKDPQDTDAAFRLVFNGGWTHSSTGALPNGTNAYADTKLSINSVMSANSVAFGIYFGDLAVKSVSMNGSWSGGYNALYRAGTNGTNYIYWSGGEFTASIAGNQNNGFQQLSRINTTQVSVKLKNNSIQTSNANYAGHSSTNFYLGVANGYALWEDRTISFTYLSDGLNNTELNNFYTAVQAFQTTLGRQV